MDRKSFLNLSARTAFFLGVSPTVFAAKDYRRGISSDQIHEILNASSARGNALGLTNDPIQKVRVGLIGLGNRGSVLIQMFEWLIREQHAEIVALSDLKEDKVLKNNEYLKSIQTQEADLYFGEEDTWKKVAEREDIDLLVIATPWEHHTPMCLYGMEHGKHVACEVPIAYTVKDCWSLIETAERTQKHCMMLENCCFNGEELWILNMINEGVFGEVNHAEGAYIHDLRNLLLDAVYYEDQWRIKHHVSRNGNFYTTHGLGPVSFYMDIGRGDTYHHLVSMSSGESSLSAFTKSRGDSYHNIACGDMNTTLIKTEKGKTIMLQFDVHTGRPYSRLNTVTGTKAVHQGYPSKLYIDDPSIIWGHQWLDSEKYKEYRQRYDHPLWKNLREQISEKTIGHGGMDFVMIYRLIRSMNLGIPLDINVYDSVMWSAVTPLSEISVANMSMPLFVPDFTGNTWEEARPCEVLRTI